MLSKFYKIKNLDAKKYRKAKGLNERSVHTKMIPKKNIQYTKIRSKKNKFLVCRGFANLFFFVVRIFCTSEIQVREIEILKMDDDSSGLL